MILRGDTNKRNKQVPNGEVANVDHCMGDDVLNELDRIAKNIVANVTILKVVWVVWKNEM